MYGCDVLFDAETAAIVRDEVKAKMGTCPCEQGRTCPLLPSRPAVLEVRQAS